VRNPFGVIGRGEELASGVVHEHVDPPVALHDPVEELVDELLVADVESLEFGLPPGLFDHRGGLGQGLLTPPDAHHRRPQTGQFERGCPPETRSGARNDANLPAQEVWHEDF
jgi:hypothetical protein